MIPVCLHVTHSDLLHVYLTCQQCPGMATVMAMGVVIIPFTGGFRIKSVYLILFIQKMVKK